jgi:hypothetical protein
MSRPRLSKPPLRLQARNRDTNIARFAPFGFPGAGPASISRGGLASVSGRRRHASFPSSAFIPPSAHEAPTTNRLPAV